MRTTETNSTSPDNGSLLPHPSPLPLGEGTGSDASGVTANVPSLQRWRQLSLSQRERAGVRESGYLRTWIAMLSIALFVAPIFAADKKASTSDTEAEYTTKLDQRAGDILKALELADDAKAERVRGVVIAQYRALRDWHDGLGPKLKGAADEEARVIRASLKELHGKFIASLSSELTPAQVERVKDRMTYDTVRVTYAGYLEMLPQLTAAQKARILDTLKEAREEAMDGGSSEEKTALFGRYKGRINNYLSAEGYDLKQAGKDWGERRKLKSSEPAKEPKKS